MPTNQYQFYRPGGGRASAVAGGLGPNAGPGNVASNDNAPAQGADSSGTSAELAKFVAGKESFNPKPFQDYGQVNIGYGTSAHGRTSITREEAQKEMEEHLSANLANVDKLNPNLSQGQRIALASLDYNTGVHREI